jgi:hypothetical protein
MEKTKRRQKNWKHGIKNQISSSKWKSFGEETCTKKYNLEDVNVDIIIIIIITIIIYSFSQALQPTAGYGLLVHEVS